MNLDTHDHGDSNSAPMQSGGEGDSIPMADTALPTSKRRRAEPQVINLVCVLCVMSIVAIFALHMQVSLKIPLQLLWRCGPDMPFRMGY